MRGFAAILSAFAVLTLSAPAFAEPEQQVQIRWDQWGVPHIAAQNANDAHYALGWAMARGRPDQLLELLGQGRGRAAELWGEAYFEGDAMLWTLGIPQSLDTLYAAQGEDYQHRLDAFARGINGWFEAHPESGSAERRRALPVSARDVLGHAQRTLNYMFMAGEAIGELQARIAAPAPPSGEAEGNGSNAWAVAPSRSESGHALLLMNPHLPWDGVFTWFEAHMTAPGMNNYGVALLGQPFTSIMFNDHLGWTHTVNRHDGADIYAVPLVEGGYRFGEQTRAFQAATVTLRIRGEDGAFAERQITLRRTVHGPVIAERDGTAYALRVAGLADPAHARIFAQYDAMASAANREQWEAALAQLQMPMFNAVYADRAGEITYISNGLYPVREQGDWRFWDEVLDGSDPALLWSEYQPYERLLRVANPATGFVQNANETGYTATIPPALDPADFPADYIAPDMRPRPQHSIQLLLADTSVSMDELTAYAHSTRLALADDVLDDLIATARASARPEAARGARVLEGWDRTSAAGSRGGVLFALWAQAFLPGHAQPYDRAWSFADPAAWPEGIADDAGALEALIAAVGRMDAAGIPLDLPWGEFARVPDGAGGTLPSSLGMGSLGAFRVGFYAPEGAGLAFNGGTSWVAAVEFGDTVSARAILPYGNFADRPAGVNEQYTLFSRGEFRPVNFAEAAIAANVAMEERLDPAAP